MVAPSGVLALNDELPAQGFFCRLLSCALERTITPSIVAIQKGLDCLAQHLSSNREAELLKAVPAELIKIVFLCSHKVLTHPRFLLAQQRTDQSATPCGYFSKATHGVTLI